MKIVENKIKNESEGVNSFPEGKEYGSEIVAGGSKDLRIAGVFVDVETGRSWYVEQDSKTWRIKNGNNARGVDRMKLYSHVTGKGENTLKAIVGVSGGSEASEDVAKIVFDR